jgi:hypothetical protein
MDNRIQNWSRIELARHQIEVAIQLFLEQHDYVSSTTLAGAAEEILGVALRNAGKVPALDGFADEVTTTVSDIHNERIQKSALVDLMNHARNALKHFGDGSDLLISGDVAAHMLGRAVENYWQLTGVRTHQMQRLYDQCSGV